MSVDVTFASRVESLRFYKALEVVSLFVLLPNALFWGVGGWLDLGRPLLNLDYFFVGVLFSLGRIYIGVVLAVLFFVVDVLVLIGQIYPFLRIPDLMYLAGLLPHASGVMQLLAGAVLAYLIAMIVVLLRKGKAVETLPALVMLNLALVAYGVHVYMAQDSKERIWRQSNAVVMDSSTINFIENRIGGFVQSFSVEGKAFSNTGYRGQTAAWIERSSEKLEPKMLLIIAESWGRLRSDEAQNALVEPILSRQSKFDWFEQGQMPFVGATVAAEFRELCGMLPNHFNLKNVESGFEQCLPRRLRELGYATVAVHGAVGLMYDRVHWYPRAGFNELHFMETDEWSSRCFSFPGVCDREIAQKTIKKSFAQEGKRFVYWLTLNTHSVYDERDLHGDFFDCEKHGVPVEKDVCRMARLHAQFFSDLAALLDEDDMKGVEVLVVGDHTPPILGEEDRGIYVKEDTVSWMHFKIKNASESNRLSHISMK